jgi:hypothetical protein
MTVPAAESADASAAIPYRSTRALAWRRLFALAALLLFGFLAARPYFVAGDDGTYIALARSIREGEYRAINIPEEPPQVQYPPLFPLLLAPFAHLPAGSVGVLRLWVALLSLGAVAAVGAAAIKRDPALGLLGALPFVVSPLFGEYSTSILTETPFVAIAYALLIRANALLEKAPETIDPLIPIGLLAAWLMRSSGVALVVTIVPWLWWKGRKKTAAASLAVVLLGMTPWWIWQTLQGSDYVRSHILQRDIYDPSGGVLSPLGILTERIPHNLTRYLGRVLPDVLLPPWLREIAPHTEYFPLKFALSLSMGGALAFGAIRRARNFGVEDLYVAASCGMFLIHPVFADRYLYAILPSLCGYVLAAIPSGARKRAAVIWSALLLIGCIVSVNAPVAPQDAAYIQAIEWTAEHAEKNDVVFSRRPAAVWFYAGCLSKGYGPGMTAEGLASEGRWIIRDDYTIGVHGARLYLDPILNSDTARFAPVFVSDILPAVKVYAVRPEPDASSATGK